MIIHLNGMPGVGKLTVARLIAQHLDGRLIDSHTIYNVAFSLTAFQSPEFYSLVRAVRDVAYERIAAMPPDIPVVMTNALGQSPWGEENWQTILDLAKRRNSPMLAVTLTCSPDENIRRMASPERAYLRKLTDPAKTRSGGTDRMERDADALLRLDTTNQTAEETADRILRWIETAASAETGTGNRL